MTLDVSEAPMTQVCYENDVLNTKYAQDSRNHLFSAILKYNEQYEKSSATVRYISINIFSRSFIAHGIGGIDLYGYR